MQTIDDHSADISQSGQKAPAAVDPFHEATGRLRAEFDTTMTALRRSFSVQRKALGLSIFEGGYRLMTFIGLGLTAITLIIYAAFLFVGSARQGLTLWTNGAWWSDLVVALVLGGSIVLIAHSVRRKVHRAALASARRGLESSPETTA